MTSFMVHKYIARNDLVGWSIGEQMPDYEREWRSKRKPSFEPLEPLEISPEEKKRSALFAPIHIYLLVGMMAVLIWMTVSFVSFIEGDSDLFQRIGSFGVFSWVMLFAATRMLMDSDDVVVPTEFRVSKRDVTKGEVERHWESKRFFVHLEIIGLGFSTLQWGFGDLFVIAAKAAVSQIT